MAELKDVGHRLWQQLADAGLDPVAGDPLAMLDGEDSRESGSAHVA